MAQSKKISKFRRKDPWLSHFSLNSHAVSDVQEIYLCWFFCIIKRVSCTAASGQLWTAAFEVMQFLKVCGNKQYSYHRTHLICLDYFCLMLESPLLFADLAGVHVQHGCSNYCVCVGEMILAKHSCA